MERGEAATWSEAKLQHGARRGWNMELGEDATWSEARL